MLCLSSLNNTIVKLHPSTPKGLTGVPRASATKSVLTKRNTGSQSVITLDPVWNPDKAVPKKRKTDIGLNQLVISSEFEPESHQPQEEDENCSPKTRVATGISNRKLQSQDRSGSTRKKVAQDLPEELSDIKTQISPKSEILQSTEPNQHTQITSPKIVSADIQNPAIRRLKSEAKQTLATTDKQSISRQWKVSKTSPNHTKHTLQIKSILKQSSLFEAKSKHRCPFSGIVLPNLDVSVSDTVEISMEKNMGLESLSISSIPGRSLASVNDENSSECAVTMSDSRLCLSNNNIKQSVSPAQRPKRKLRRRRKSKIGSKSEDSVSRKTGSNTMPETESSPVASKGKKVMKKRVRHRSTTKKHRRPKSKSSNISIQPASKSSSISNRPRSLSEAKSFVPLTGQGSKKIKSYRSRENAYNVSTSGAAANSCLGDDSDSCNESLVTSIEAVKIGTTTRGRKKKTSKSSVAKKRSLRDRSALSMDSLPTAAETGSVRTAVEDHYKIAHCSKNLLPEGGISSYSPVTGRGTKNKGTYTHEPEKLLEDFREQMNNIKGKSSIPVSLLKVRGYSKERKNRTTLQSLPKTYQQIGLAPLVRNPSSTNYFPLISAVLAGKGKSHQKSKKARRRKSLTKTRNKSGMSDDNAPQSPHSTEATRKSSKSRERKVKSKRSRSVKKSGKDSRVGPWA